MFKERFEEIKQGKEPVRTNRLSALMTDMEQVYKIPCLFDATYASNNPVVMRLYREISRARRFVR